MARIIALFCLLFLTGCDLQPGRWTWRHDDATYAERNRARDIDECEDYAVVVKQDGKIREFRNAREYGGWGSFEFEFCMNQRGWRMEFSGNGDRALRSGTPGYHGRQRASSP